MEVAVHREYEQYGTQIHKASADTQGRYTVQKVSLNGDEESGLDK
jgi:hypothetical protein